MSAALEPGQPSLAARLARLSTHGNGAARYTVLGEVAQGGMGRILRAWDESLSREVAMKVVPRLVPEAGDDARADHERALARFIEEARITGQLDHPGIVPVYEIGLDAQGAVFFTMPLVRGQDLRCVFELAQLGAEGWDLARVVGLVHTVCLTLAFAHSKGVVHRDLKPENIMVGRFGEVLVMDWGLALLLGRSAREGIVGTPAYMAPEQAAARAEEVGPRSDVYSLGAILYEFFARRRPHEASLATETHDSKAFAGVLAFPPRPLSELSEDAPPELVAIVAKAMARRPEERYASALEMADDLAAWLAGRVVSAHPIGGIERFRKWRRRNRGLARALDGLVVVLALSATAFLAQERRFVRAVEKKGAEALASGYAANLSAADLGLRAHVTEEAKRRLAACDEAQRGWEWRHLALRSDASQAKLAPRGGPVRAVAVSPDGTRLAVGSDDGSVQLWDARTHERVAVLAGHEGVVTAVAFAPDGTKLASASRDKTVRLWDARSGAAERTLEGHTSDVLALAFAADGLVLASGDVAGTLVLTPLAGGERVTCSAGAEADALPALGFLSGTHQFAAAYLSGHLRLWGEDGTLAREQKFGGQLEALAADPTGRRLALAVADATLVLDARTLEPERTLGELGGGKVSALAFSADGARLAACGFDNVVRVWEAACGRALAELDGHDDDVSAVAFFPDGRRLASGAEDQSVRLWDLAHLPACTLVGHEGWVEGLSFSPDGTRLVTGGRDRTLRAWDARTGELLSTTETPAFVDCLAWSAKDELVFGCGDPVPRAAAADAPAAWRQLAPGHGFPRALAFDARAERLVWRDSGGFAHVLAGDERALASVETGDGTNASLALAPDGSRFATGTDTGAISLWDAATGRHLFGLKEGSTPVVALCFSPDGKTLAAGRQNRTIALFDLDTRRLTRLLEGHENRVSCLAFHPDGTRLASGSYDKTLRIWSLDRSEALLTLRGHTDGVTAVAFDPTGTLLASSSKDRSVRLWRTAPAAR